MKLLRQILNSAVNDRIINYNPCAAVKKLKEDSAKSVDTNHRALTEEETNRFISMAEDGHYYYLFLFLLNTGCRIGEALALTWFDISFDRNEIVIRKTVSRTANNRYELLETPKTDSSKRTIPITGEVGEILKKQKERNTCLFPHCQWIFPNRQGGMANYCTVNQSIAHVIDKLNKGGDNFEHFTVHTFRDTFATRCIEQGMQPNTLKALLGHSSLKMTMDLYAHVMPDTKAKELGQIRFAIYG